MKRCISVLAFLMIVTTISACQKTPENEAVVGKITQESRADQGGETRNPFLVPEAWEDSFVINDSLTVNVDATINIHGMKTYPVVRVAPGNFSAETVERVVQFFADGIPLHNQARPKTKSELTDDLIQFKQDAYNGDMDMGSEEDIQQAIANYEEGIRNAPESVEEGVVDYAFEDIHAEFDLGHSDSAVISVINRLHEKTETQFFYNNGSARVDFMFDNIPEDKVKMNKDDAISQCDALLRDLAISDFAFSRAVVGTKYKDEADLAGNASYCYILYYTRANYDIFIQKDFTDTDGDFFKEEFDSGNSFARYWPSEEMVICVDEDGIFEFRWEHFTEVKELVTEDVALLSFEQIQERFVQQMKYTYAWEEDEGIMRAYDIAYITMSYMRIKERDSSDYLLVPVWDFYGSMTTQTEDVISEDLRGNYSSYITLNAIDGSVIERAQSY